MLLLAHAGLTIGAVVIVPVIKSRFKPEGGLHSTIGKLSQKVDFRWLLIGSLLPDIIDKPVGLYLFPNVFHNGRIFSHSLLFLVMLCILAFFFYRRNRSTYLITISLGVLMHIILDSMWKTSVTLFWPFMGVKFPVSEDSYVGSNYYWQVLIPYPDQLIYEVVGGALLLWFGWVLLKEHQIWPFIRHGRINIKK